MLFSVIIPQYNDFSALKKCLAALENQTISTNDFEVIIVDNNPEEKAILEKEYSSHKIYVQHTQSYPSGNSYQARNKGISIAKGLFLAFIDSDCVPDRNWLKTAQGFIKKTPNCLVFGGKVSQFFAVNKRPNAYELYHQSFYLRQYNNYKLHNFCATANIFIHKTVFARCGLFSTACTSGGDREFCLRIQNQKITIFYSAKTIVLHPARKTFSEICKLFLRTNKGTIHLIKSKIIPNKHPEIFQILFNNYHLWYKAKRLARTYKKNAIQATFLIIIWNILYYLRILLFCLQFTTQKL